MSNQWVFGQDAGQVPAQDQSQLVDLPDGTKGTLAELVAAMSQQGQQKQQQKNYVPASLQSMVRAQGAGGAYGRR